MNCLTRAPVAPLRLVEIGQATRTLGVTARTLRHYQDRGLIRSHRLARNVRGYDLDTLEQLKAIIALRAVGLPISAIQAIIALRDRPDAQGQALRAALGEALSEQQAQIQRLSALADQVAAAADTLPASIAGLGAATSS